MRRPRNELPPAGIYHVTTRGVARTAIFLDDDERRLFLRLLAAEVQRHDWRCHAFCLMTTHYHLVVETELWRLSDGMHRLNGTYALAFNRRHRRSGHLFGERFAAWLAARRRTTSARPASTSSRTRSGQASRRPRATGPGPRRRAA